MSENIWVLQGESLRIDEVKKNVLSFFAPEKLSQGADWIRFGHSREVDDQKLEALKKEYRLDIATVDAGLKLCGKP